MNCYILTVLQRQGAIKSDWSTEGSIKEKKNPTFSHFLNTHAKIAALPSSFLHHRLSLLLFVIRTHEAVNTHRHRNEQSCCFSACTHTHTMCRLQINIKHSTLVPSLLWAAHNRTFLLLFHFFCFFFCFFYAACTEKWNVTAKIHKYASVFLTCPEHALRWYLTSSLHLPGTPYVCIN